MLANLRTIAIEAARAAATVHTTRDVGALAVSSKASDSDLVTCVDREAEAALVRVISKARPNDTILSEEGARKNGTNGVTWVLDPLDGTTNLVHGYPHHAVAVGVLIDGVRQLGVVLNTANERLYVGVAKRGASCNEAALAISQPSDLKSALVGTGFLPDDQVRALQAEVLKSVLPRVRDIRRSGSPALDFCSVASGSLDAYYEFGIAPWDIVAGAAIAEASGATVVELDAGLLPGPLVIAGSADIVAGLTSLLSASLQELSCH